MRHYIITWASGAKESIYGFNYINALYVNSITPEMKQDIVDYIVV